MRTLDFCTSGMVQISEITKLVHTHARMRTHCYPLSLLPPLQLESLLLAALPSSQLSEQWLALQCLAVQGTIRPQVVDGLLSHANQTHDPARQEKAVELLARLSKHTVRAPAALVIQLCMCIELVIPRMHARAYVRLHEQQRVCAMLFWLYSHCSPRKLFKRGALGQPRGHGEAGTSKH